MDLGAFCQIENLEQIMKNNNIYVPRLRGLRLMKNESPLTKEEINKLAQEIGLYECACLCECDFNPHACVYTLSDYTNYLKDKYMTFECDKYGPKHTSPISIKWDKLHGKKRKAFKYVLRHAQAKSEKQYRCWNKYAGKDNVLYIHSRIGGNNWKYYNGDELEKQAWFIEKVDDAWDSTYCDIYALIK